MELLLFARNVRQGSLAGAPSFGEVRREVGAVVGEPSPSVGLGGLVRSFVEVRLPLAALDPCTEIQLLVGKGLAAWGHPGGGRVLRFRTERGSVAMLLEPGFERARDLCRALDPVLPRARLLLERAMPRPSRARASVSRPAVPQPIAAEADRVVPLEILGRAGGSRLVVPRIDR